MLLRRDVIIVGSGPAGTSTALGIAARSPALAAGTTILERAAHPREKTCAGGVIPKALRALDELGVTFDVPYARVDRAAVETPAGAVGIEDRELCRVVRRAEFDARLAAAAREWGVELREEEPVRALVRDGDGVRITTDRATYWARAVVGADGAGSVVRRALVPGHGGVVGRAAMVDVPVRTTSWSGFAARRYDFDFRACARGLRGYGWVFPCLIDGVPHANIGVYGLPPVDGATLRRELDALCANLGAGPARRKAFPIRTWSPRSVIAAPRSLLVGDAAGVDALMGEGISFALEYGRLAADTLVRAAVTDEWAFADYGRAVAGGAIGRKLRRLAQAVRVFYGRYGSLAFRLAAASPRAQAIGLRWYNGMPGWDGTSGWRAIGALLSTRGV